MHELRFALVDLKSERAAIHRGKIIRARVFGGAVEIQVERRDVRDRVIERRERRRKIFEVAFVPRAHDHDRRRNAELAEHRHDERRLVFCNRRSRARKFAETSIAA